jgi:hypothetical protein
MASILSGMAPPSLARTTAAVSAENAGPEMDMASGRETSASSRTSFTARTPAPPRDTIDHYVTSR